jgi:hypothetical protein
MSQSDYHRQSPPAELPQEPTLNQLNAWFEVLHRLAALQRDNPMTPAHAPKPLRPDIDDCVARGWVRAFEVEVNGQKLEVKAGETLQIRLMLTPAGRELYDAMCQELADQGRPVTGWRHGN